MIEEFKEYKVMVEITSVKGSCHQQHQVGQKFEVSLNETGGLCGAFYAANLHWITTFQFGGNILFSKFAGLDKDTFILHCPDVLNMVSARMTRELKKVWTDEEVSKVIKKLVKKMEQEK